MKSSSPKKANGFILAGAIGAGIILFILFIRILCGAIRYKTYLLGSKVGEQCRRNAAGKSDPEVASDSALEEEVV